MLKLFYAELRCGSEIEDLISSLPAASQSRVEKRRCNALSALGELLFIRMMDACCAPYDVAFGEYGKPYSPVRRDVSFNISHSGRIAVGALLVGEGDVGIDVEYIDRGNTRRHEGIARRFFTEAEQRTVSESRDGVLEFYLTWTRKEAYLKYTGTGIARPLSDVDTTSPPNGTVIYSRVVKDGCGGEYALSVCAGDAVCGADDIKIEKIF